MKFAYEITDEDKDEYLECIAGGMTPDRAAEAIGTTGTQMRRFRARESEYYDEDFATRFLQARAELIASRRERVEDAYDDLVEARNVQAVIKGMMAYNPDWAVLRHQNFRMEIDIAARLAPHMTRAELEEWLEREKAIEAGEVIELPTARDDAA